MVGVFVDDIRSKRVQIGNILVGIKFISWSISSHIWQFRIGCGLRTWFLLYREAID